MRIQQERYGDVIVVKPHGALVGADADQLRVQLTQAAEDGSGVVLDVSAASFVDSRGLEVLVDAGEQLIRGGGTLKLARASPTLLEVLELCELASMFERFDDVNAAVGSFA